MSVPLRLGKRRIRLRNAAPVWPQGNTPSALSVIGFIELRVADLA